MCFSPLKKKALFFFLIKHGVDIAHLQLAGQLKFLPVLKWRHGQRGAAGAKADFHAAFLLVRHNGKTHPSQNAHRLIQIKALGFLPLLYSQDCHARFKIQKHRPFRAIDRGSLRRHRLHGLCPVITGGKTMVFAVVIKNRAETGKGQLIKILNHMAPP